MLTRSLVLAALALVTQAGPPGYGGGAATPTPNADGKYTLVSEGIRANFIPYGASISNLFMNDTNGVERDLVLGFDNATYYSIDTQHPHLGGVPGTCLSRVEGRDMY